MFYDTVHPRPTVQPAFFFHTHNVQAKWLELAAAAYEALDAQREYAYYQFAGWQELHSPEGVSAYVYRSQAENAFGALSEEYRKMGGR